MFARQNSQICILRAQTGNVMARTSLEMLLNIRIRAEWKFLTSSPRMKIWMGLGVILGFIMYIHVYAFIVVCID